MRILTWCVKYSDYKDALLHWKKSWENLEKNVIFSKIENMFLKIVQFDKNDLF